MCINTVVTVCSIAHMAEQPLLMAAALTSELATTLMQGPGYNMPTTAGLLRELLL